MFVTGPRRAQNVFFFSVASRLSGRLTLNKLMNEPGGKEKKSC